MKKLFAIVLSLVLALSFTCFATDINWSDIESQAADLIAQGEFYSLGDIGVQLWIPNVMPMVELTEDDVNEGYVAYFMTEDQSAAVSVMYVDTDGMELADYAAYLTENGASDVEEGTINGLAALSYNLTDTDACCVAFATEMGYILEFTMAPMSDENFSAMASIIASSIQPNA